MIYKVSYVVDSTEDIPGAIINTEEKPAVGDRIQFGAGFFEIVEVMELSPPSGNFHFLHATCKPVKN